MQKVQVEELELLIEHHEQERERVVFLVADNVGRKPALQFPLHGVSGGAQERQVSKISPGGRKGIVLELSLGVLDFRPSIDERYRTGEFSVNKRRSPTRRTIATGNGRTY
jgi:hypothetical protein